MNLHNDLNERQVTAVTVDPGPTLVLAGPGSGKTRVLTYRIAHLIGERQIPPWQIMAVTFTNKAAREMRQRVDELLGGALRGLTMGTFHAACVRILRRESEHLPHHDRNFVIFDTADQQQAVKQVLRELNLDEKKFRPRKLLNGISNAKNELVTPNEYQTANYIAEITKRVYHRYQATLQENNAMDFDDLLMNTVLLFDQRPDLLQKYQDRYRHILVDEFQDTNTAQYQLLQRLAAAHGNLFVVGDSDQSIYKWRGADFRNINRFREAYPDAEIVVLEQNYRSTQLILDAATAVIKRNTNRIHKELFTERKGGAKIVLREVYDEKEEAAAVLDTIENLMLEGYSPGDCAVMYRTNAQSRILEEAFVRRGMAYKVVGATQFYQRREIKDMLAFLRLVHNPRDAVSFDRVVNVPPRGIGKKTKARLTQWAERIGVQPAEATLRLATDPDVQHLFRTRAYNALADFGGMLDAWIALRDKDAGVADLMDVILEQTDYYHYLDDDTKESRDRWENVMELRGVAGEAEGVSLGEFLEEVALVSETDNLEDERHAAVLLTLHAAKGLEFPVVFITGLEDGVLPHVRSMDDPEELAEERRLFYVGLTRAEDRVYLSHAFRRTFYGETEVTTPSRFLNDLPTTLIEGQHRAGKRRAQTKSRASKWNWSQGRNRSRSQAKRPPAPTQSNWQRENASSSRPLPRPRHETDQNEQPESSQTRQPQYRSGQKVRHATFGAGTVIESKAMGDDEEVHVAFPDGVKRLAASFANLEIVEEGE